MRLKYYVPTKGEPWWRAIAKRLTRRKPPRFPRIVLVETRTGCNGMCVFCSYPTHHQSLPKGVMSDELYAKIVEECGRYRVLRFSPYNINEPTLDPKLEDRIQLAREHLRRTWISITTNGSLLDEERVSRLIGLDALDEIVISFQSTDKDAYERTMPGLSFDRTFANVNHLTDFVKAHRGRQPRLTVTMVETEETSPHVAESRRYWQNRGVRTRCTALENRGGTVDTTCMTAKDMVAYRKCWRPFRQTAINFDGTMVLCCADYLREVMLGNVGEASIYELWNGKRLNAIRSALLDPDGRPPGICQRCLVAG